MNETWIEGRNSVLEAIRAGRPIDRLYVQDGLKDGPVQTIVREAKKAGLYVRYETKDRLTQMAGNDTHQGVLATVAAYEYVSIEEILQEAKDRNEPPFIILLDGIEDPHNLGSIIRTAH
ncbi:MAG: 23S rRNA (guanosine(2251)-2'-O)-methyltransferase RlmB, partial [Lachnospiraceae bacterium]|nr:23S rRNA (guanosine(2251)-2'-O)-methyltransferase RlmB [Lachnospiraceae bacterium]